MESNLAKYEKDLQRLIDRGFILYCSMAIDLNIGDDEDRKKLKALVKKEKSPSFKQEYEVWYSEAQQVIKQIIPDRLIDFIKLYKEEKRKEVSCLTYAISDYMIGLRTSRYGETVADGTAALPKFQQQLHILESAKQRFESSLFDIKQILQAEIFDNEIDSARELLRKGFIRGAGAIGGVVLERHLSQVCQNHKLSIRKKNPTINDYNEILKKQDVIEVSTWRFIQHLADLRNLCDHKKKMEPTKDNINDLIEGVNKISKTIF